MTEQKGEPMHRQPDDIHTMVFDWGSIKWLVTPDTVDGTLVPRRGSELNRTYGTVRG